MLSGELEQPQAQAVLAAAAVAGDVAAALQRAEHAEDLADRPTDLPGQLGLGQPRRGGGEGFQQVEALLEGRRLRAGRGRYKRIDFGAHRIPHLEMLRHR
jgi:hypothetical protein